jgi:hypothetical protein
MAQGYDEIIELESLNDLLMGFNCELVSAVLVFLVKALNARPEYVGNYHFDVIPFGLAGYYPVVGVQYLHAQAAPVGDEVSAYFENEVCTLAFGDVLTAFKANRHETQEFVTALAATNAAYHRKNIPE